MNPWLQETQTFSQDVMPYQPPNKRRRFDRSGRGRRMVVRRTVPRAIKTRGTPAGYYEIPVTIYRRIYFNMSTGLWVTDPYTGAQSGATGYNGFGMGTQLDTSNMYLGGSGANINVSVPGFAEMQAVFDEVKIARIDYEFWVSAQAADNGATLVQAPNIWVVVDENSNDAPTTLSSILQYSNVRTVKGDINNPTKITVYPKVRLDVASDGAEASTSATTAFQESAKYCSIAKPSAYHFALRGWFESNAALATAYLGYLCIKETQIRRYKVTK